MAKGGICPNCGQSMAMKRKEGFFSRRRGGRRRGKGGFLETIGKLLIVLVLGAAALRYYIDAGIAGFGG